MKRVIALVLAMLLVLALIPGAGAAQTDGHQLSAAGAGGVATAALLEAVQIHQTEAVQEYNFFIPTFDMYGMTVVSGDEMTIEGIVEEGNSNRLRIGVVIYAGTYETLTPDAEPVASAAKWSQNMDLWPDSFIWDTTGVAPGDYTAIYYLEDWRSEMLLFATVCDLYISDREIPLEDLEIYVMELGQAADRVYIDANGARNMSLGAVRVPYHTTDRRKIQIFGNDMKFSYGGSTFPEGKGVFAPMDPGTYTVSAWIDDKGTRAYETVMTVVVENNAGAYPAITPLNTSTLCYGVEQGFEITLPAGKTLDDALIQFTGEGLVEVSRVEGNVIWLRNLLKSERRYDLVVAVDGRYAVQPVVCVEHNYLIRTIKEQTCTEPGLQRYTCQACGDTYDKELPAAGHYVKVFDVTVFKKATKPGIREGLCYRCGQIIQEEIAPVFTDTEPDRFYSDALDYCYEKGLINGLTDTTFGPSVTLSRAQLVTLLYRHAGSPEVQGENPFTDVPAGKFYTAPVIWASENGIVSGYGDGTFLPNAPITREQIVSILHRYVKGLGRDNGAREDLSAFEDLDQLHSYARESMEWAVANGVVKGVTETQLGPGQSANRGQTVTILYRIITGILGAGE